MQTRDDLNTSKVVLIGIVSALLLFIIIVGIQAWFYNYYEAEYQKKVVAQQPEELNALTADQQETLNGYRWIDKKKQVVGIPIDRAMDLLVKEAKQQ